MTSAPDALPASVARRYPHRYAVLDVETNGLDPQRHRVLQIAVTTLGPDGRVEREWQTLVDPGAHEPLGPVDVHGITRERLAGAPSFREVAEELADLVRDRVVVAHNARFDWGFLAAECARVGHGLPTRARLDTIELNRLLGTPARTMSLESLCEHWGIRQARPHDAGDDVRVLVEVLRRSLVDADAHGLALPVRDPLAAVPLKRRVRRRWRRLRWKVRRRLRPRR